MTKRLVPLTTNSVPATEYLGTRIKGASILARLEHVRKLYGEETLTRVFQLMPVNEAELLSGRVLPSNQYALEINGHLDDAIARVVDPDDAVAVYRALGQASAQANLDTIHRAFVRGGAPHELLRRFPAVRRTYYSDGIATYEETGENTGILRVEGATSHTQADCESTAGYFERGLELAGGESAKVELTLCRTKGDTLCEFTCSWRRHRMSASTGPVI